MTVFDRQIQHVDLFERCAHLPVDDELSVAEEANSTPRLSCSLLSGGPQSLRLAQRTLQRDVLEEGSRLLQTLFTGGDSAELAEEHLLLLCETVVAAAAL